MPGRRMTMREKWEYLCENCHMFACPIVMKSRTPVWGCNYGEEIMNQIKEGMKRRGRSRPFEDVAKELGL